MITIEMERLAFEPGNTIQGLIRWTDLKSDDRIEIRLIWYTAGKGDRDFGVVATESIDSPTPNGNQTFRFAAPFYPHSFSGQLISLIWRIEVINMSDLSTEFLDLVIAPDGVEILLHAKRDNLALDI